MIETPRHAAPASCTSHQAINHIVVDHQHRGNPQPATRYSSSRGIIVTSIPMFRELGRPLFWELQKHFKKKILWMSWVLQKANFDCRAFSLWASARCYQAINLNMTILTGLSILSSSHCPAIFSQFLLEMFWTISWAALSWVCWWCRCRGCPADSAAIYAAVDWTRSKLIGFPWKIENPRSGAVTFLCFRSQHLKRIPTLTTTWNFIQSTSEDPIGGWTL